MACAANFRAFFEGNAQLFQQLTRQGRLRCFPFLDFSAGKFPFEGRGVVPPALADKESAVPAFDDGGYDDFHGLSEASWKMRSNCFAPATSGGPGVLSNSSRTTWTCLLRMAGTSFQAATW